MRQASPRIILILNETYRKSMFDWNSFSSPVRNEGVTCSSAVTKTWDEIELFTHHDG